MDFDKPKVYGDTFISDGLVFLENPNESRPFAKIKAMAFSPKEVKIGKLHSITLSDGEYVSHNFETPNRVIVEGLK